MAFLFGNDKSKKTLPDSVIGNLQNVSGDVQGQINSLKNAVGNLKFIAKAAEAGESVTINFNSGSRGTIICQSFTDASNGIINYNCDNIGVTSTNKLIGANNQNISNGTNKIVIRNGGTAYTIYAVFTYTGSAS